MKKRTAYVVNGFVAVGIALTANAWTVDGSGVATVASGETKLIASDDDLVGVKKIVYTDGTSKLSFAADFITTNLLEVSGAGSAYFSGATLTKGYFASSGSPYLYLSDGKTVAISGSLNAASGNGWCQIKDGGNGGGVLEITSAGSKFCRLRWVPAIGIRCGAVDALYSTAGDGAIAFNGCTYNPGAGSDGMGVDLNGFSTRVKSLDPSDLASAEGANRHAVVKSATAATLQLDGLMTDGANCPIKFTGMTSFLWNGTGKTLNLVNVVSDSTGDLGVADGTLVVKWDAGWSGETVTVTGGVLQVESPKTFSNKNVLLTVKAPGQVVLNQDIYVNRLIVGAQEISPGKKYTVSELGDCFSGGGTVSVRYEQKDPVYKTHTWIGGEGESVTSPSAWREGLPDFTDTGATLVFSEGGSSAAVTEDILIFGLRFLSAAPFALTGDATLSLYGGLTVDVAAEPTVASTVSANVEIPTSNSSGWSLGANTTLNLEGDVSGPGGTPLVISGDGALVLSGDNSSLERAFELNNAKVNVRDENALGSANRAVTVSTSTVIVFDAPTNNVPVVLNALSTGNRDLLGEAGSLVQNGLLTLPKGGSLFAGGISLTAGVYVPAGSLQIYAINGKRCDIAGTYVQDAGAYVQFLGGPIHLSTDGLKSSYPSCVIRNYGSTVTRVVCERDNVFASMKPLAMSTGTAPCGILDLNGHDQTVPPITHDYYYAEVVVTRETTDFATVTSAVPATLTMSGSPRVMRNSTALVNCSPTNALRFCGNASLVYAQTGDAQEMCLVNVKSDTTGSLTVNSGRLVFDWGAGWTATTNVTINGGVLRIAKESESCAFGPAAGRSKAILRISGDGRLELGDTVVTTVKALSVADGEFVKAGTYGGPEAGLDATHTLPQLAGKGRLAVRTSGPGGLMLIFR